jgi:DNA repair protein SbcD/Mre11
MKILHTSDWHIGRLLYGRKRYDEFSAFLDWLAGLIEEKDIDALLVSGDIFDTRTPSNRAQQLYYRFLCRVSVSRCRHIVIIAGNHDSPSFLNAPREILQALNVHVVGSSTHDPKDEVIVLKGLSNVPEVIVCAVPYLRDRDIRVVRAGESIEDKNINLIDGVKRHYADVCRIALEKQKKYNDIPVIGMGHLFTAGGKTIEGDGVRELYVGSLAHVGKNIFPDFVDYWALGHLHVPQRVGKSDHIRYSGSPIPMGYGEAKQEKSVVMIEVQTIGNPDPSEDCHPLEITLPKVPCFQALERISGNMDEIIRRLDELKSKDSRAWLEIEYTGTRIAGDLRSLIESAVADTSMAVLRIKNKRVIELLISQSCEDEMLDDLDVTDVFNRLLDVHEVEADERPALIAAHKEIITSLLEQDTNEE